MIAYITLNAGGIVHELKVQASAYENVVAKFRESWANEGADFDIDFSDDKHLFRVSSKAIKSMTVGFSEVSDEWDTLSLTFATGQVFEAEFVTKAALNDFYDTASKILGRTPSGQAVLFNQGQNATGYFVWDSPLVCVRN
jgi:hypothetical protein